MSATAKSRCAATSSGCDADVAIRLQDSPLDLIERLDLTYPRLLGQIVEGEPLAPHDAVNDLALLDQHDRLTLQKRAQAANTETQIGDPHPCKMPIVDTTMTTPLTDRSF